MTKVALAQVFVDDGGVPAQTDGRSLQDEKSAQECRSRGNVCEGAEVEPDGVAAVEVERCREEGQERQEGREGDGRGERPLEHAGHHCRDASSGFA